MSSFNILLEYVGKDLALLIMQFVGIECVDEKTLHSRDEIVAFYLIAERRYNKEKFYLKCRKNGTCYPDFLPSKTFRCWYFCKECKKRTCGCCPEACIISDMCYLDTTCSCINEDDEDDKNDYEMYKEEFFRKLENLSEFTEQQLLQKAVRYNNKSQKLSNEISQLDK